MVKLFVFISLLYRICFGQALCRVLQISTLKLNFCCGFSELYDDDSDTDVELDTQGSVIKHLLSQVKIGMDLTKVVLPTFILERRSLLEMYADYFAHPDIFVR